jgi:hypothetical protein
MIQHIYRTTYGNFMSRDKYLQILTHQFKTAINKQIFIFVSSSTVGLVIKPCFLCNLLLINNDLLVNSIPLPPILMYAYTTVAYRRVMNDLCGTPVL